MKQAQEEEEPEVKNKIVCKTDDLENLSLKVQEEKKCKYGDPTVDSIVGVCSI